MNSKINAVFIREWIDDFLLGEFEIEPEKYFKQYNMSYEKFKDQVIFEIYIQKYRLEENHEKSLKKGIKNYSTSSEQKRKRTFEKVRSERKETFDKIKENTGIEMSKLLIEKRTNIEQKKEGYQLNNFQHYQLSVMEDYELLRIIQNKKIYTSKNILNTKFKDIFAEYDSFYSILETDFENYFEKAMHIFLLESRYCIEFMYKVTQDILANKYNLDDITKLLPLLILNTSISPPQNNTFIFCRDDYVELLRKHENVEKIYSENLMLYALKNYIKKNFEIYIPIITSFKNEEEYFKSSYNINQIINIKEWNDESISTFKKVASKIVR